MEKNGSGREAALGHGASLANPSASCLVEQFCFQVGSKVVDYEVGTRVSLREKDFNYHRSRSYPKFPEQAVECIRTALTCILRGYFEKRECKCIGGKRWSSGAKLDIHSIGGQTQR